MFLSIHHLFVLYLCTFPVLLAKFFYGHYRVGREQYSLSNSSVIPSHINIFYFNKNKILIKGMPLNIYILLKSTYSAMISNETANQKKINHCCVMSPLLYKLIIHGCMASQNNTSIIK